MFARGAYDERLDGPLRVLGDSGWPCEGKGWGVRGWAGGAESLEGRLGEEVWSDKEAPRRSRGADGVSEESS